MFAPFNHIICVFPPVSHSLLVFVSDGAADDKLGGLKHTNILSSAQALKLERNGCLSINFFMKIAKVESLNVFED